MGLLLLLHFGRKGCYFSEVAAGTAVLIFGKAQESVGRAATSEIRRKGCHFGNSSEGLPLRKFVGRTAATPQSSC